MQARIDAPSADYLRRLIERESGIAIGEDKGYLLEARLAPIMRSEGLPSFEALVSALHGPRGDALRRRIIEGMTTQETLWFRDRFPFDFFRDAILKDYPWSSAGPMKVWSAACSTGQEPYSLSILVEEFAASRPGLPVDVKILATDISEAALHVARQGVYDSLSLRRGMDEARLRRFFIPLDKGWKIRPEIAARVTFRQLNLLEDFRHVGRFYVIFCRNVLIYFTPERKMEVLDRLLQTLLPGGYLVLGASEVIPESIVLKNRLARQPVGGGIYRKPAEQETTSPNRMAR